MVYHSVSYLNFSHYNNCIWRELLVYNFVTPFFLSNILNFYDEFHEGFMTHDVFINSSRHFFFKLRRKSTQKTFHVEVINFL